MKSILPEKRDYNKPIGLLGAGAGKREVRVMGHNQAIDLCEQALKKAVDEACDEGKIESIMLLNRMPQDDSGYIVLTKAGYEKHLSELSTALSQHIRGCFYKQEKE